MFITIFVIIYIIIFKGVLQINIKAFLSKLKDKPQQLELYLFICCAFSIFLPYSICLFVFLFTFIYVLYNAKVGIKELTPKYSVFLFVFLIYSIAISATYKNWLGVSMTSLLFLLSFFGIYLQRSITDGLCEKMLDAMAYGNLIALVATLIQKYPDTNFRTVSFFSNANYYAYICETLIIALVFAIYKFGKKPIYYISISAAVFGILCSGCRTAWIAIPVGIIVLLTCLKKYKHLSIFSAIVAFICCLVFLLPKIFFPRAAVFEHDKDLRFLIWDTAIGYIKEFPIFGRGLMTYYITSIGRPHDLHSHNLFLDILVNFGIIGSIILIAFVVIYLIKAIKALKYRNMGAVSIAVLSATIAHGFTDIPFCGLTTISILIIFLSFAGFQPPEKNSIDKTKELL